MRQGSDIEASEAALSSALLRRFCQARLVDVPAGAAVVFDHALRVRFAEGTAMAGVDVTAGQLLSDLVPPESWEQLRRPFEAAMEGRRTTFDFVSDEKVFSIDVAPLDLPGEARGALAVSHPVTAQTAPARPDGGLATDAQLLVRRSSNPRPE
jgi:hypothetical protein